jgi:hypothetical protein
MLKDLKVCTISKYPPYMAGHSFEALYQERALYEMTGEKHYEVTYDPSVYDKAINYNNSPELMSEAEQYLYVYRMLPADQRIGKVLDGTLIKAFIGQVIQLIIEEHITVLSTFYLDPHRGDAHLFVIEDSQFQALLRQHPDVAIQVIKFLANQLDHSEA